MISGALARRGVQRGAAEDICIGGSRSDLGPQLRTVFFSFFFKRPFCSHLATCICSPSSNLLMPANGVDAFVAEVEKITVGLTVCCLHGLLLR